MGRDLAEIRQVIEGAMKEMAKLKDHVDYQLDLRAPFAFLPFNQITQAPAGAPPILAASGSAAPCPALKPPVQVDPGYSEPAWGEQALGGLHCITEVTEGPGQRRPDHTDLFQDPRENAEPTGHPSGPNKAGEETTQTLGGDQYHHFVQEARRGGPGAVPPPPDYVEPGKPEALPDQGDPGGTDSQRGYRRPRRSCPVVIWERASAWRVEEGGKVRGL